MSSLRSKDVMIFSVGVGRGVNETQLGIMAGDPDRIFQANDYSTISSIGESVINGVCKGIIQYDPH